MEPINFRKKYLDLFRFNEELRVTIESALDKHPEPKSLQQGFLLYALAKSHKTQAAILLLSENGFGQDAGILARSIFELAVTALYIAQDETGKVVERFFDHDWIMRANMYNSVPKGMIEDRIKEEDPTGETKKEVFAEAEKIKKKYLSMKNFRWSEETLEELSGKVGRQETYKTVYHLQCNLAHPNPRNINDYFIGSGGIVEVNAGPSDEWIKPSLVATFASFLDIVVTWDEEFNFYLKPKLDDLAKRYAEKIEKI